MFYYKMLTQETKQSKQNKHLNIAFKNKNADFLMA